jgi:hypothetical protein
MALVQWNNLLEEDDEKELLLAREQKATNNNSTILSLSSALIPTKVSIIHGTNKKSTKINALEVISILLMKVIMMAGMDSTRVLQIGKPSVPIGPYQLPSAFFTIILTMIWVSFAEGGQTDKLSWALDESGCYSTNSLYLRMSHAAAITHVKEVWSTRVTLKIKVFLWQLFRGRLPSGEQLAKRHGPSNGDCALCGDWEDCNHNFFNYHLAKFMGAEIRKLLSCSWNPTGVGDFIAIV